MQTTEARKTFESFSPSDWQHAGNQFKSQIIQELKSSKPSNPSEVIEQVNQMPFDKFLRETLTNLSESNRSS